MLLFHVPHFFPFHYTATHKCTILLVRMQQGEAELVEPSKQTYQRGIYVPQKNYRSSTTLYLLLPGCWNKSSIQSPATITKHNFSKSLPIFDFIIITYQLCCISRIKVYQFIRLIKNFLESVMRNVGANRNNTRIGSR